MKKIRQLLMLMFALICATMVHAQDKAENLDSFMRSTGRSYVVVAVMVTILAGLIVYLVRLDRKISRLEKDK